MRVRFAGLALLLAALAAPADAQDRVMMQGFYWDAQPGGVWYDSLTTQAARLGWAGFDAIWLPPPSKGAASGFDVGYTPYDYYDLGGYDSCGGDFSEGNGSCYPTRYGTEASLKEAIATLQARGLEVYADVVLNHRSGGALEDNAYGRFFTDGGGSLYSEAGRTYTAFPLTNGSGRVAWADGDEFFFPNASNNPDNTFDFYSDSQLAGFHGMYRNGFGYDNALHDGTGANLALGDSLIAWGEWLTTELGLDGYRFDFVKGIHPEYLKRFVDASAMRGKFHVHELYDGDVGRLQTYLGQVGGTARAPAVFDFNLRFSYRDVLDGGAPIWRWQDAGLINQFGVPFDQIVTFVDNHDFDRLDYEGQVTIDGHSPVVNNKILAYAHMLTHPGLATVWWRDYYHYDLDDEIDELVRIRKAFASGDYYALTRGSTGNPFWTINNPPNPWESLYVGQRTGDGPGRGLIVAINKHPTQWAEVFVTQQNGAWANRTLKDVTGNGGGGVTQIFPDNRVRIWAPPLSYTVWVPTDYALPAPGPMPAPDTPSYFGVDLSWLDAPATSTAAAGTPVDVGAVVYVHGKTNAAGAASGLTAEVGWGAPGTDPATWTDWHPATYTGDVGPSDRFEGAITPPAGTFDVAARVQYGADAPRYAGLGGFWNGTDHPAAPLSVVDLTPPTIALNGAASVTLECPAAFEDPGATATDESDPNPSVSVAGSVGSGVGVYTLSYTATDAAGNTSDAVVRTVEVVDTTAPEVTLAGGATVEVVRFSGPFADPGATATDACEGSLPATTADAVDTTVPGATTLTYTATDAAGNVGTATRTVYVVDDPARLPAYALLAGHHLKTDRSTTAGAAHANGKAEVKGKAGEGAHDGPVTSADEVKVKDEQSVAGDVTAPSVRVDRDASVAGAVAEAAVATVALPALPAIAPGSEKVDLKGGSRTLAPGAYGDVSLDRGAVLRLSAGTYVFDKLDAKNGARVEVDLAGGPVEIRVAGHVKLDGSAVDLLPRGAADSRYLTVYAAGHVELKDGASLAATVVAPGHHVRLDGGSTLTGSVAARDVDVKRSTVAFHAAGFAAPAASAAAPAPVAATSATEAGDGSAVTEAPKASVEAAPEALTLGGAVPNPTRGRLALRVGIPEAGPVAVAVFDVRGRRVLGTETAAAAGWHEVALDAAGLPAGVYVVRVVTGAEVRTGRFTVVR